MSAPCRTRTYNPLIKSLPEGAENAEKTGVSAKSTACSTAVGAETDSAEGESEDEPPSSGPLARLISAWPTLPDETAPADHRPSRRGRSARRRPAAGGPRMMRRPRNRRLLRRSSRHVPHLFACRRNSGTRHPTVAPCRQTDGQHRTRALTTSRKSLSVRLLRVERPATEIDRQCLRAGDERQASRGLGAGTPWQPALYRYPARTLFVIPGEAFAAEGHAISHRPRVSRIHSHATSRPRLTRQSPCANSSPAGLTGGQGPCRLSPRDSQRVIALLGNSTARADRAALDHVSTRWFCIEEQLNVSTQEVSFVGFDRPRVQRGGAGGCGFDRRLVRVERLRRGRTTNAPMRAERERIQAAQQALDAEAREKRLATQGALASHPNLKREQEGNVAQGPSVCLAAMDLADSSEPWSVSVDGTNPAAASTSGMTTGNSNTVRFTMGDNHFSLADAPVGVLVQIKWNQTGGTTTDLYVRLTYSGAPISDNKARNDCAAPDVLVLGSWGLRRQLGRDAHGGDRQRSELWGRHRRR